MSPFCTLYSIRSCLFVLGLGRLEHGGIDLPVNDYVNIDDLMVINILPLKECKQKAQIIVLCPYIFLVARVGFEPTTFG